MGVTFPITVGTSVDSSFGYDHDRTVIAVYNNSSSAVIYYGFNLLLTTSNGFPIPPKTGVAFARANGDDPRNSLYLISDTVGTDVRVSVDYGGA